MMKIRRQIVFAFLFVFFLVMITGIIACAEPYAYITNSYYPGSVNVIDTENDTFIATVKVGSFPGAVAVTPDGTRAYVTNFYGSAIYNPSTVSVIDTATNNVTATISVGKLPDAVAVNPEGTRVYVANQGSNTVSVIDTATNNVTSTVNVGSYPFGVAVTPDGKNVYVTNDGSGTVSVINAETNIVTTLTLNEGDHPSGVVVSPDGKQVYVTNTYNSVNSSQASNIYVIDTTTNDITAIVPIGIWSFGIAVNPTATRVYVPNAKSNTVSVIDTATNNVTATVPVGKYPTGVAVTPDGKKLYVTNSNSHTVSVIDTATNIVIGAVKASFSSPTGIAVNPVSSIKVNIISPKDNDQLIDDESAKFSCQVSGGIPPYKYEWTDNSGDIFSNLQDFDFNFYNYYGDNIKKFQPSGTNKIRLTVTDATGARSYGYVQTYVTPPPPQIVYGIYQNSKKVNNPIINNPYEIRVMLKNVDDKPHYYSLKLKTPPEDNAPKNYIWNINPITTEIQNNIETQLILPGDTNTFTYKLKSNWVWIPADENIPTEVIKKVSEEVIPTLKDVFNIDEIFQILIGNMIAQPKVNFKFYSDEKYSSRSLVCDRCYVNAEVYVGNSKLYSYYDYLIDRSIKLVGSLAAVNTKNIYVSASVPAAWIYSKYHYQMAIDPDPDYKIVINPEPYNIPEIDSLPDGLEKQLDQASFDMLSYNRAEVLSYARYVAAEEDNASEYELIQLEAVKKYNDISLEKIDTVNNIYSLLIQNHMPLTDDDIAKIKKEISTNGLPTEWVNILTREGFESDIPDIIQTILDADNQNYKNPSLFIDSNIRDAQLRANLSEEYAKDIIEIKVNELGSTPTEANQTEIEKLEKLKTDILLGLNKGYATRQLKDNIKSMSNLANGLIFETNNNNYLHYLSFAMDAQVKSLTLQMPIDTDSPSSITNLQSTNGTNWINWTWINPLDLDFNHTEIYLNGVFQTNTTAEYFNATNLQPETSYTISTRTVNNIGNVNKTWVNLTATTEKELIVVEAGLDQTVEEGTNVTFKGSFTASGTHTYSYKWDYGDGSTEDGSLDGSHTYADDGIYKVNLTVTDETGDFGYDSLLVTVNNAKPVVEAGSDAQVTAGDPVSFTGTFSDPGWLDKHIASWNFREGTVKSGIVSEENVYPDSTGTVSGSFSYFNAGAYNAVLSVSDDDGGVGQDRLNVKVSPIIATVNFDPNTLNLGSGGKWITVYIELPSKYNVSGINVSSLVFNGVVQEVVDSNPVISDHDSDGIPELMVKFDRAKVEGILKPGEKVPVTVNGKVKYNNGVESGMASFEGKDIIKVIKPSKK